MSAVRRARPVAGALLGAALLAACLPGAARAQAFQHDSSLPIEITADVLEVEQRDQIATFTGNVDAVQGELVLSADKLRVFYGGSDGAGEAAPAAGGSIRRIEAEGNVFITSPQETAQGESGVYDVADDRLSLDGSVVLTRGENVIRGDELEMDLASGRSRVLAATPEAEGGGPEERVRALFMPERQAPEAAPGAGPSSEPETEPDSGPEPE